MAFTTIIGLTAAALTTAATFPQVIKSWKTKKTEDISLLMYTALTVGVVLWLLYGILINDLPVILANALTFVMVASVLGMKIRYG